MGITKNSIATFWFGLSRLEKSFLLVVFIGLLTGIIFITARQGELAREVKVNEWIKTDQLDFRFEEVGISGKYLSFTYTAVNNTSKPIKPQLYAYSDDTGGVPLKPGFANCVAVDVQPFAKLHRSQTCDSGLVDQVRFVTDNGFYFIKPVIALAPTAAVPLVGAGDPVKGQAVFTGKGCSGCHSTSTNPIVGPGLGGIATRGAQAYIEESILQPGAFEVTGFAGVMPTLFQSASDDGFKDLVAYLLTLR